MKTVLIDGAGGPAGINFIDSLKESSEKFSLIATDINKFHLEWMDTQFRYLMPKCDSESYIKKLNQIIDETNTDLIHAQPDNQVNLISENRDKLKTNVFLPSKETIRICQNKATSSEIWEKNGLLINNAIKITNEKDLDDAVTTFGYPYWIRASAGNSSRGSTLVKNKETAIHWISYWNSRNIGWEFIAQEYFPGKNIAFQSLWHDGELKMSQARERLEYLYPSLAPSGITNTPVVARTINQDIINKIATDAITTIDKNPHGIFCVDLKEDKKGVIRPTEINAGRFFTTSYFFTKAGINMPYYFVKLGLGEQIPNFPKYNILPEGLYWIRHIDANAVLIKENEWKHKQIS